MMLTWNLSRCTQINSSPSIASDYSGGNLRVIRQSASLNQGKKRNISARSRKCTFAPQNSILKSSSIKRFFRDGWNFSYCVLDFMLVQPTRWCYHLEMNERVSQAKNSLLLLESTERSLIKVTTKKWTWNSGWRSTEMWNISHAYFTALKLN